MAKRIVKLINAVADTVNADPDVNRFLKVAFVPNFNVQNAELIYPACARLAAHLCLLGPTGWRRPSSVAEDDGPRLNYGDGPHLRRSL